MTEPNWDVYRYVLLLFEGLQKDGYRKGENYERLTGLAEKLELPADSPAHKILATTKAPTDNQAKMVATVLGKRAVSRHFELGEWHFENNIAEARFSWSVLIIFWIFCGAVIYFVYQIM